MNKILIHSLSASKDNIFENDSRDDCNRPMIELKKELLNKGVNLTTLDKNKLTDEVDYIFFFDTISFTRYKGLKGILLYIYSFLTNKELTRNVYKECLKNGCQHKMILFLWEASAICPNNFKLKFHKNFDKIFTWNDDLVDNKKYFKIFIPNSTEIKNYEILDFKQRKLLVNISMNKSSLHKRELYSERKKIIKYFDKNQSNNFDLYGYGWNAPVNIFSKIFNSFYYFKTYKGFVKDKGEILSKYKFCICFENICNEPGYITEKILDCFKYKCIPIYYGASNINEIIDPHLFVDYRKFSNFNDLNIYLTNFTEDMYNDYLCKVNDFLKSDKYYNFSPEKFSQICMKYLNY